MSDIEGFGLDIYAIDGFQGAAEWSGTTVDYDEVYNVWMHVDNRSVEDGDKFTVFIQQVAVSRWRPSRTTSDRNPAEGSVDLGLPGPDLDTLFVSSHNGSLVLANLWWMTSTSAVEGSMTPNLMLLVRSRSSLNQKNPSLSQVLLVVLKFPMQVS